MLLTTPSRISTDVRRLCRKLGHVEEPVFVPALVAMVPGAELNNCFDDVRREIEKNGGAIQHGWTIWQWPGIFIEAEFHAVWRDSQGRLIDVTPKLDGEDRILFAPDLNRVFCGKRVDNVRLPIGHDPRIKELLRLQECFHREMDRRRKDTPFGTPFVVDGELLSLQKRAAGLEVELMQSRDARRAIR